MLYLTPHPDVDAAIEREAWRVFPIERRCEGRDISALMVISPRALDKLSGSVSKTGMNDEYFTRPYSIESLRWRVEAMCIRSQTVDDGSGPVIQTGEMGGGLLAEDEHDGCWLSPSRS